MAVKLDQHKIKHQIFHLCISLAAVLVCMTYVQFRRNWVKIGSFRESLIVPIVLVSEILKVILARHYGRREDGILLQKHRPKRVSLLAARDLLVGVLVQSFCALLYTFICIILGAPVLQNYEQTFFLAVLLTLVSVSPTVFLVGGNGAVQVCFCEKPEFVTKTESTALDLFKYNAVGSILGAWAGSVVAPLDWDRDWQVYPIPNVIGSLLGSALCNIFACLRVLYTTRKLYLSKKRT